MAHDNVVIPASPGMYAVCDSGHAHLVISWWVQPTGNGPSLYPMTIDDVNGGQQCAILHCTSKVEADVKVIR